MSDLHEILEEAKRTGKSLGTVLWERGLINPPSTRIARIRRGRYVRIPPEWSGRITNRSTIRKRASKQTRKARNRRHEQASPRARAEARAPRVEEWEVTA